MNFIVWIIFGGLAGWVASMFAGTNKEQGKIANIFVGIIGSVLGGWLFGLFGGEGVTGFNWSSFFVAVVGSVVLLLIVKAVKK